MRRTNTNIRFPSELLPTLSRTSSHQSCISFNCKWQACQARYVHPSPVHQISSRYPNVPSLKFRPSFRYPLLFLHLRRLRLIPSAMPSDTFLTMSIPSSIHDTSLLYGTVYCTGYHRLAVLFAIVFSYVLCFRSVTYRFF